MSFGEFNKNLKQKKLLVKINIFLCCFILFGLIAIGFQVLSQNKNFRNTIALATTVKPETFTELYFENHLSLPSEIKPYKTYSFSFTIHNLENQDMTYPYEIYLQAENTKIPVDQGTVFIKNNQHKTIVKTFIVNAPLTKSLIVVNLTNKNQQIDFWINK
jgi:hypothetical protein